MHSPYRHAGSIFFKGRPIHLTFFVTKRCNSRCPFCFYLRSERSGPEPGQELSLDEIGKVSRSMGTLLWLAFSGGEIYLRDDLPDVARIFYQNNRPSVMLFPTNGLLPEIIAGKTEQILRECPESVITVKLSLDGIEQQHDEIRRTPGSFSQTMKTYELLRKFLAQHPHFELGVNTIFCSENQDSMAGIIDFVKGLKDIRTHTISLVRGDLSDRSFQKISQDKYVNAIKLLEEDLTSCASRTYRFRGGRIKAAQDIMQRRFIHQVLKEQKRLIPCYAGSLNLVLSEQGEVYPCEVLTDSFGNIRDHGYDIMRVIRTERAKEIVHAIQGDRCFCTHECYFMTNILFNPRLYPHLLKEYLRIR